MMQAEHHSGALQRVEVTEDVHERIPAPTSPSGGAPTHRSPSLDDGNVVIDLRSGEPTIELVGTRPGLLGASRVHLAAKRLIDIVGACVALILFGPLFVLIGAAVKVSSPGPVFYLSDRVGKDGEVFRFLKFRTMTVQADQEKPSLSLLNEVGGPVFKIQNDPRITSVGRFLRRFSLDELPQILHVLSGKMSLVGPRPPIPEEVAEYTAYHWQRLSVKPGLTCIWQVSGRSTIDFETWVELDLDYIRHWSLRYDLALLARTVPAVLVGRGAF